MDSILPSADRLRNIQLRLPFPFSQPLVDAGSMPLLESVYLSTDFDDGPDPGEENYCIYDGATSEQRRSVLPQQRLVWFWNAVPVVAIDQALHR